MYRLILVFIMLTSCTYAESRCLGMNQSVQFQRYECVTANATVAMRILDEKSINNQMSYILYSLDDELLLSEKPAKYALILMSHDIGEPVVLIGISTSANLMKVKNKDKYSADVSIIDGQGSSVFEVSFRGLDKILVNGKII